MTDREKIREILMLHDDLEGKIREMEEAIATVTEEELINMLQKLERAVRDYADIGGKQFNQDEEEFWRMCDVNDEAEKFLSTITRKQKG